MTIWMDEAKRWLGAHERRDNARLWGAFKRWLAEKMNPASAPWCGAFVAICIRATLPKEKIPDNAWGARNWLQFGVPCPLQAGAIAVFSRPGHSWSGHVGFISAIDRDRNRVLVLGGNQSDAVTETWISVSRLLGTRWPATAPKGSGKVASKSSAGATVSKNEE